MTKLKTLLQYILAIPLLLFGDVRDPYIDGALEEEAHDEQTP